MGFENNGLWEKISQWLVDEWAGAGRQLSDTSNSQHNGVAGLQIPTMFEIFFAKDSGLDQGDSFQIQTVNHLLNCGATNSLGVILNIE